MSAVTAERAKELAASLASFRHYPPEKNTRAGFCYACGGAVAAGEGVVVLGTENGGNFAAHLHTGCATKIGNAQKGTS